LSIFKKKPHETLDLERSIFRADFGLQLTQGVAQVNGIGAVTCCRIAAFALKQSKNISLNRTLQDRCKVVPGGDPDIVALAFSCITDP
jgi:hypothetical protein